ncbi:MAG: type II secretion system F family protein, partial [Pseudomonadales bacterium]
MAAFAYTALDTRGKQRKGVLEADSIRQIRQLLRDQNLVPLDVDIAVERKAKSSGVFSIGRRIGALDRVLLTRQLATLIGAGLPIEEALQAVAQQSEKQHVNALIMGIRSKVLEGHSLASSLAEFPGSFSEMYRSTVAAGEQSGFLDKVLENLADYTERQFESRRNVEMAMLYPAVLSILAFCIVGALMVYVVPDMVGVLENMGQELPWATRFLIGSSEIAVDYWWAIVAVIIASIAGVRWLLDQPAIRLIWDRQKLTLPLAGRISRSSNAARYANTLSI